MRKGVCLLLPILVGSCNQRAIGFGAVSIRPIYGWADGCNTVKISGHGFDESVTATIAGNDLSGITLPEAELDKGYLFYGTVPEGEAGTYADVKVVNGDGEEDLIQQGYYYVACPAPVLIEGISQTEGVAGGTEITVTGCNLDASSWSIRVGETGTPVPLTSVCGTGVASFTAPAMPDGEYILYVTDASGAVIWPTNPCPLEGDTDVADTDVADTDVADTDVTDTDVTDTDTDVPVDTDTDVPVDTDTTDTDTTDTDTSDTDAADTADSADTGVSCEEPIVLVYGGAQ